MKTMKSRFRHLFCALLVFAFVLNSTSAALGCGPFTLDPIFSFTKHADYPLAEYAEGKTGIVPNTFGRMSLFSFYRYLNDSPLSQDEQKQVVEALEHRIGQYALETDEEENQKPSEEKLPDFYEGWQTSRAQVTGEKTKIETEKRVPDEYYYFSNCLPDAFKNATKTLHERISLYGNGDHVREWLKGQDAVFSNCDQARAAPAPAGENSPEWLRKDRQYQIAAAQFYMGDFQSAHDNFESIAADENSVWRHTAKFVAARTLIRQSSFIEITGDEAAKEQAMRQKQEFLQKASDRLQNILADNSMREFHPSAKRLFGLVKYRLVPEERRRELGRILAERQENQNLYNDLIDYIWLLETIEEQATARGIEFESKQAQAENQQYDYEYRLKIRDVPAAERENDLTDWLFTYQAVDGTAHAFEKWKETGKPHWLVAAIVNSDPNSPQIREILADIGKIQPDSAAFPTVRYHQIRLLLETGKRAEARQKLDEVMTKYFGELPVSSQNKFLAQKMSLASNLEEFLKYAQRKPAAFLWSDDGAERGASLKNDKTYGIWENRTMFDADSVAFFNEKMPLSELRRAALSQQLPPHLKKFLIAAVWTRAFVLGNQAIEREFTPLMQRYAKDYSPLFSKYASATGAANREAAALIAVLRYPVMQPYVPVGYGREDTSPTTIDSIRGNWWCVEAQSEEDKGRYDQYPFGYPKVSPDFLSAEQTAAAEREQKQLLSLGNSATYLARRAVEFALQNPAHPNTPEILHLGVRSTRYGCTDEQTGNYSRQAFQILHKKYSNSPWTRKTPYWFAGN